MWCLGDGVVTYEYPLATTASRHRVAAIGPNMTRSAALGAFRDGR